MIMQIFTEPSMNIALHYYQPEKTSLKLALNKTCKIN